MSNTDYDKWIAFDWLHQPFKVTLMPKLKETDYVSPVFSRQILIALAQESTTGGEEGSEVTFAKQKNKLNNISEYQLSICVTRIEYLDYI